MKLYGVWRKDTNNNRGDWLRELPSNENGGGIAILVFMSIREAQRRAALHYGFSTYTAAKKRDWCEVRLVTSEQKGFNK